MSTCANPVLKIKRPSPAGRQRAVAGGITAVAAMPNTEPPVDSAAVAALIKEKAAATGFCRVYPIGTLSRGRSGAEPADFTSLYGAGVRAFSDDGAPVVDSRLFRQILQLLACFPDTVAIAHSEDLSLAGGGLDSRRGG